VWFLDSLVQKIDFEIRMREGICKLLAVSTQKDQVLHAVKNLMVCNARILAYKTELQKQKEEPVRYRTGGGMLDFIELKPLTLCYITSWLKRFFGSSTGSQRYAIFCLFKMGAEVFDTDMVIVDKAITDICFENVTIFDEAGPDFQVKFEVYSCCTDQSSPITNTPKKLAKKLKTSIGKATGKKINSLLEEDNLESFSFIDPIIPGAKYSLLAHTTLGLESAEDNFRTHNLIVTGNEESSFWLPLYGSMCCSLVAQPFCMAKDVMSGFLISRFQKQMIGSLTDWRRLYCVLRGGKLFCYYIPEEIEAKVEPALTVSINKETRIRAVDRGTEKRINNFTVTNPVDGEAVTQLFAADSREELHKWMEAFWQHFYDLSQWKHCCEEFMKIEIMSPRKPPLFLTKEATSVYHDISKWDLSFQAAGPDYRPIMPLTSCIQLSVFSKLCKIYLGLIVWLLATALKNRLVKNLSKTYLSCTNVQTSIFASRNTMQRDYFNKICYINSFYRLEVGHSILMDLMWYWLKNIL
uniref:Rhotekin 2 n=1 Tax=Gopherus evgoodei TaxID=1825980 RepID=A0A8C4WST6_9SAUR